MKRKPTLLKLLVQQGYLTHETFRQAFERTARELGLGELSVEARQYDRWLNGEIRTLPYPSACRVLERMFGRSAQELFTSADHACEAASELDQSAVPTATRTESVRRHEPRVSRHVRGEVRSTTAAEREAVMAAAHESSEHAGSVESSALGPVTLEQLHADAISLARSYVHVEPLP